jgi:hypothetical protein
MNAAAITPVVSGDLEAEATSTGRTLELLLRGSAEIGAKPGLDQFLTQVASVGADYDEVRVDIRQLEFMNSSCFKSLLTWIVRVQDLPESRRHKIKFISNPALHWQKRSLHSLASMGGGLVEVEEHTGT